MSGPDLVSCFGATAYRNYEVKLISLALIQLDPYCTSQQCLDICVFIKDPPPFPILRIIDL